jgi:hypothetical protein
MTLPGFAVSTGVDGLSEPGFDMISGGLYALKVKTPSARFPMLLMSLSSAMEQGLPCALISGASPEDLLARLDGFGLLSVTQAVLDGKVQVFSCQDDFSKKVFRYTAERFVQELEEFEVKPGSFLIFDQADELLSLHDVRLASEQLQILSKWFYKTQTIGLMVFARVSDQHMATLNSLMDSLTGIATLGGERSGLELTFIYWQSTLGVAAARSHRLETQSNGLYQAAPTLAMTEYRPDQQSTMQHAAPSMAPPPVAKQLYFYSDTSMDSLAHALPGEWFLLGSARDLMLAARNKPGAMLFVDHSANEDMWEFAKLVHALRKNLGTSVQIMVRETDAELDDEATALVIECGANTIMRMSDSPEDYVDTIGVFTDQIFPRRINPNFAAIVGTGGAYASATVDPVGRYSQSEPLQQAAKAEARASSQTAAPEVFEAPHAVVRWRAADCLQLQGRSRVESFATGSPRAIDCQGHQEVVCHIHLSFLPVRNYWVRLRVCVTPWLCLH